MTTVTCDVPDDIPRVKDPHHNGASEYAYYRGRFWTRTSVLNRKWCIVKRLNLTPARVLALAELLKEGAEDETRIDDSAAQ